LQGSLETFALPDVLVLLSSTKKDGELRVVSGRVDGRVWLEKGQIVHSQVGTHETKPVDAIFELLRLDAGTFNFENESKSPKRAEPQMIDLVLADAQVRLGEWKEIAKVVPHLDAVIDMTDEAPGDQVQITKDQWRLLRTVAGGRSVHDVMVALSRSEFDTCKSVKDLIDNRLASIDVSPVAKQESPAKAEAAPAEKPEAAKLEATKVDEPAAEAKIEASKSPLEAKAKAGPDPVKVDDELEALAELASRPRKVRSTTSGSDTPAASPAANKGAKLEPVDEAKALVAQLAALGGDDEEEVAQKVAEHLASGGELPEVPEGDEPINRGLLLKFLSSVRN
jgi:hypothetical protein